MLVGCIVLDIKSWPMPYWEHDISADFNDEDILLGYMGGGWWNHSDSDNK